VDKGPKGLWAPRNLVEAAPSICLLALGVTPDDVTLAWMCGGNPTGFLHACMDRVVPAYAYRVYCNCHHNPTTHTAAYSW
jgi:hypothetical protein